MKRKAYNMTVEEIDAATVALNNQRVAMPFLLPVAPEVRSKSRRLASRAIRVTERRLKAAREHLEALPSSFDLRGFDREVALTKALEQCRDAAARLYSEVQDTLNQVGTESFRAGGEAYAYIKAAFVASPGLQRTVDELSTRRTKSSKEATPDTQKPPPPAQTAPAQAQTPPPPPSPEKKAA